MDPDIHTQARKLLENNTREIVLGGRTHRLTVPSPASYPFQWFWDSCFHAIAWTYFDIERAKEEIYSLLTAQRENGFIPHVIFWDKSRMRRATSWWHWQESRGAWWFLPGFPKPRTTELMQPPVLAQAIERIWLIDHDGNFLTHALPRANHYFAWLEKYRDPDHDHLISIVAPFESGLDWSPAYDRVLGFKQGASALSLQIRGRSVTIRNKLLCDNVLEKVISQGPFHVEDVLVNAIYSLNLRALSRLNHAAGNNGIAQHWEELAHKVSVALVEKCWDESRGAFFNLSGRDEKRYPVLTIQSIMPIILPDLPYRIADTLVRDHLLNPKEFWLPFPVPSVAANEPSFSPQSLVGDSKWGFHWRGASWINTNWFLVHGLRQYGYHIPASHIAQKSLEMVAQSGFREEFNPITGQGYSAESFGWSTQVIDM